MLECGKGNMSNGSCCVCCMQPSRELAEQVWTSSTVDLVFVCMCVVIRSLSLLITYPVVVLMTYSMSLWMARQLPMFAFTAARHRPLCYRCSLDLFSLLFSPPNLRGRLADRHQTFATCSMVTQIYKNPSEIWVVPAPSKFGSL